jgi:hypothetical protein
MRRAATDLASVRAACPVRPGRIAVSPGCKTKACLARTSRQNESAARHPVSTRQRRDAALTLISVIASLPTDKVRRVTSCAPGAMGRNRRRRRVRQVHRVGRRSLLAHRGRVLGPWQRHSRFSSRTFLSRRRYEHRSAFTAEGASQNPSMSVSPNDDLFVIAKGVFRG